MSEKSPIICECATHRRVIALEGLIGAGKSTLVDKIKSHDPDVEVLKEQINPFLLDLFYSNPSKYGFAMQWAALQQRIYQSKLLKYCPPPLVSDEDTQTSHYLPHRKNYCKSASDCVWDRSMLGDYAFALWNHLTGNLDQKEMEAYESMFGASVSVNHPAQLRDTPFVSHVDTYFWLVDDPMECKRRVELRQSNAAEQGIPDQYYQGLEDVHIFLFLKLLCDPRVNHKVKVLRWDQYQHLTSLEELLTHPTPAQGVQTNTSSLILQVTKIKEGVKPEVVDKYGFYFLDDASKIALYQYLSNGGDPMCITMNMNVTV